MRTTKAVLCAALAACLSGCMWIMRLPFPKHEDFADDGTCTNRTWQTLHPARKLGYYPCAVGTRWVILRTSWREIPPDVTGRKRYNARWLRVASPFAFTLSLVGLPLDALVDTCFIYYDYLDRNADE